MRKVELIKGVSSSVLGFGCASILGAVDAKKAERTLHCAVDHGITHFDLARSYGYGEAEKFIGQLLKGKRDQVVLASKFGIKANWKASLLRPAKPLLRFALDKIRKRKLPETTPSVNPGAIVANTFHNRVAINSNEMRKSLEKSLKALQTDHLDYFFIHEPGETLMQFEDLQATAQKLKSEGKIRGWGIAFLRSQEKMHRSYLDYFDVWQFDNSPGANGYETILSERGDKPNVIFSPLRGGSREIKPADKLKKLFIDFPNSVILCSMFNEQHLKENAMLAT